MSNEIDMNDSFAKDLLARVPDSLPPMPMVLQNPDGDCIEILLSRDNYRAKRLDSLVTIYVHRETDELVGVLIKGIRGFIRKMLEKFPGFRVEIQHGKVKLEYLFTASLWSHESVESQELVMPTYETLRRVAEQEGLEVDYELQEA
ncbi:MAG: hypothetical protein JW818_03635 [Pirellulales bacterium]|nr:hypothetical protein [Pirellulales bacterium]